jgi:NAD(P)H dehydrogenase (quinone)
VRTPERALLVLAHPREDSLTARAALRARARLEAGGATVDVLDLHAEGFDPRMTPADEPDWADRDKEYSAEVVAHLRRVAAADTIVVVFPVWWFGLPAILKGWFDRVWNYGETYGRSRPRLAGKRMRWLGLTGYGREHFTDGGWDELLDRQLRVGISQFCGIDDAVVRLVHGSVPGRGGDAADHVLTVLAAADAALDDLLGDHAGAPVASG